MKNFEFKLSNVVKWGAIVIPIVPAASMADKVFKEVSVGTSFAEFALITILLAFVGGIGFEMVGIGAGHLSVRYFVEKNWVFFGLSSVALIVYVSVGYYEFGASTSGLFLIIAPFVYLLSGMIESSEAKQAIEKLEADRISEAAQVDHDLMIEERKAQAAFDRTEKAKQAEFKRQQKAVGQVAGSVSSTLQKVAQMVADPSIVKKVLPEVKGTKKVIVETLIATPNATRAQLAAKAGVSPQAISNNAKSLADELFSMVR